MLSPFAEEYARAAAGNDPEFIVDVDPADEMYAFGLRSLHGSADAAAVLYFSTGRLIADSTREALAWRFGGRNPGRVLDFAAGFGRATRFLVRDLGAASLTVAEIDPAALAFQRRAFGVDTLLSPAESDDFRPEKDYDAVVVASFFSHLSEIRFRAWLERLWAAVAPGGALVFSTHGPALLEEDADWSRGVVFRPTSETTRLDPDEYGTSWVTADFVENAARHGCAGGAFHAVPFGLDGNQDLYVIARGPALPIPPLRVRPVPRGGLHRIDFVMDERLTCDGGLDSEAEAEVVFLVRGTERARVLVPAGEGTRPWRFDIDIAGVSPDDVLRIEGRADGRTRILAMGTLRPYL